MHAPGQSIYVTRAIDPPEQDGMSAILRDYYEASVLRLEADGGRAFDVDAAILDFWDHLDNVLPPNGALLLARDVTGRLVGCGTLARIDQTTGEMKRLFVAPVARGKGLGRRLVEERIAIAREMGLTTLVADTLKRNVEMQRLYESLGFMKREADTLSGTIEGFPDLAPFLIFYRLDLTV